MVEAPERTAGRYGLRTHGLDPRHNVYWNLPPARLIEESIVRDEGMLTSHGPLRVTTGEYTGRSPKDKFFVKQGESAENIWWGPVNQPIDEDVFDALHVKVADYLSDRDIYVQDLQIGADPAHRIPLRVITEKAWHSLFANTMFIRPSLDDRRNQEPQWTILQAPMFEADPEVDGTRSKTFILVNLEKQLILVGGTEYAGEIKKSMFSIMNYLMPLEGIMSMHCSANAGENGDVALFFGLSGTGKTTLSSDPSRMLIGDDEHGWTDNGVFNYEGGCYAKVINLSASAEPDIYKTTRTFGTVVENVILDEDTREILYGDSSLTENTRAAYPIEQISNSSPTSTGGHPKNIMLLTADAFGVLPPIAKLSPEQACYYFLSGYTAKVAGTERGLSGAQATFSACFADPFLTLHPTFYTELLRKKIERHQPDVWLINTGWTGGAYGEGKRIEIKHTRAMVNAALSGELHDTPTRTDPIFGLQVPVEVPGVAPEVLNPRETWSDKDLYDEKAHELAKLFVENFETYADRVEDDITESGPKLS